MCHTNDKLGSDYILFCIITNNLTWLVAMSIELAVSIKSCIYGSCLDKLLTVLMCQTESINQP